VENSNIRTTSYENINFDMETGEDDYFSVKKKDFNVLQTLMTEMRRH
jgi:hypothetical protein